MDFLLVFLGGGIGAMLRHAVNLSALRWTPTGWPLGTLCINVLGSLLMGIVVGLFFKHSELPPNARLFFATGILGGFTTFSTYALEIVSMHERGASGAALAYALGSIALGVIALMAGAAMVR